MASREQFLRKVDDAHPGAEVRHVVPILWQGWDLDDWAAVLTQGGSPFAVTTDHGRIVRMTVEQLAQRLAAYAVASRRTERAITMLNGSD
jgi:hypothetical protein